MDILMVTAELAPYARASRTGDAVSALSKALCQLEHKVTVAVPRHPGFEGGSVLAARRLTPLALPGGDSVTVLDGQLPTGATLVLFDVPGLFDHPQIYAEEGPAGDAARYAVLSSAATALAAQRAERGEAFDVVHLHDWPAAGTALGLSRTRGKTATVLTIHDGFRRGVVPAGEAGRYGVGPDMDDLCREGDGVSLLAAGAAAADAVTALSPTVATDLLDATRFGALSRALASREAPALGILGGLDYAVYNPATDSLLKARYDAEDPSNKGSTKTELLKKSRLELATERPLVAVVVDPQEGGVDLALESVPRLLKHDVSLLVLVRKDADLAARIAAFRDDADPRLASEVVLDDATLRRAAAAADIVVYPARYDGAATWARVAERYGALPVARATGAHVDAIVDCDAALETGTGFLFDDEAPDSLIGAVARALSAYRSPRWAVLRRRVMRLDLAWDRPARRYVQVYRQAIAHRNRASG
jgi:starch synthase